MADADLDVAIRTIAKAQNKTLLAAVKARRDRYLAQAAKAKTPDAKARFKQLAGIAWEHGTAAAKRLLISADNAADSYARSVRMAAEAAPVVKKAVVKKEKPVKKAVAPKKPKKKATKKKS
ncbi:MAG: hypothetical protein JWR89_2545 [Tardiphaga sp.]|uniref:hypothetical protein n=1 Tax=Tardiphaga sp. TaxID=1926292 RepID=UPI00262EF62C|nr:hypothetical protein [Tardiphaga sp.]MDB5502643.1 hypothetical protein [Tardiphaga sp.]